MKISTPTFWIIAHPAERYCYFSGLNKEETMFRHVFLTAALGAFLAFAPNTADAVTLPDGTCDAGGMRVKVKGGKIVAYQFSGRAYPVRASSASVYKIGAAGALRVQAPKGNSFKGIFAMNGRETPATFKCK